MRCTATLTIAHGEFRLAYLIYAKADIAADAAGGRTAVTEGGRDRASRLTRPYQDWGVNDSSVDRKSHHVAITDTELVRVSLADMERIAPDLFGEGHRAFLKPGIIGKAAIIHRRIGRQRHGEAADSRACRRYLRQFCRRRC